MARQLRFVTIALALTMIASSAVHGATTCALDGSTANVAFSTSGTNRVITSNLCPNHAIRTINPNAATTGDMFGIQTQQYPVPLAPTLAPTSQWINVTCLGGPIGLLRSGSVIQSVFPGGTCGGDAVKSEGFTFDECGGHSDQANRYHYHMTPSCTLSTHTTSTTAHSPILGYLFDGIPIYGPRGDGGNLPTDLDSCGGHASDSGNGGKYHYHLKPLAGSLPEPTTPLSQAAISSIGAGFPYTPACLRGCVPDTYLNSWRNMGVTAQTSYASCVAAGTAQAQAEDITSNTVTTTAAGATTTATPPSTTARSTTAVASTTTRAVGAATTTSPLAPTTATAATTTTAAPAGTPTPTTTSSLTLSTSSPSSAPSLSIALATLMAVAVIASV